MTFPLLTIQKKISQRTRPELHSLMTLTMESPHVWSIVRKFPPILMLLVSHAAVVSFGLGWLCQLWTAHVLCPCSRLLPGSCHFGRGFQELERKISGKWMSASEKNLWEIVCAPNSVKTHEIGKRWPNLSKV